MHFDSCQQFADAVSRASRKRQQRQRMTLLRLSEIEPIRVELIRILPEGRVPLDEIGWDVNLRAGRNEIVTEPIVSQRSTRHEPACRIKTQRLFQHLARISKPRQVIE